MTKITWNTYNTLMELKKTLDSFGLVNNSESYDSYNIKNFIENSNLFLECKDVLQYDSYCKDVLQYDSYLCLRDNKYPSSDKIMKEAYNLLLFLCMSLPEHLDLKKKYEMAVLLHQTLIKIDDLTHAGHGEDMILIG